MSHELHSEQKGAISVLTSLLDALVVLQSSSSSGKYMIFEFICKMFLSGFEKFTITHAYLFQIALESVIIYTRLG